MACVYLKGEEEKKEEEGRKKHQKKRKYIELWKYN